MHLSGANILIGQPQGRYDGHAHVFDTDGPLTPARRYTPARPARFADYCALLARHGLNGALLVQPSFLGTDNTYLLDCLRRTEVHDGLLFRGVAVTGPATPEKTLVHLAEAGVVGMRLNLIGQRLPNFSTPDWRAHLRDLARLGWHLEVQIEGARLPPLLPVLGEQTHALVIDHFALPTDGRHERCPGFQALINTRGEHLFVKLSAPYRAFPQLKGPMLTEAAVMAAVDLIERFGPARMVWGSDWPWTRHEEGRTFNEALGWQTIWERLAGRTGPSG